MTSEERQMEGKKNPLGAQQLIRDDSDRQMAELVRGFTDLKDEDLEILLEVAHSLPFVGNLEGGDTYINVLTRKGQSMVVAQYRHPDCDLYKRSVVGDTEKKEDEPAVYRALEKGISGRGLIGIIDDGRLLVRHTVSPILNRNGKIIGSLTYEYPNTVVDTEPIRIKNKEGETRLFRSQLNKATAYLQDALLFYDENGICTFANIKAEELYQEAGYQTPLTGQNVMDLKLTDVTREEIFGQKGTVKREVQAAGHILEARLSAVWEEDIFHGFAVVYRDKTKTRQLEDEITSRVALIHEVHHRVKNNLQTIISLVGLEAAHSKDAGVKEFARAVTAHVRSMNVTYELLSKTGSEHVSLRSLLERICENMLENRSPEECRIVTQIRGDDVYLMENTASTVALIVNELIQNSLKYAFPNREEGRIFMQIKRETGESWVTVCDNGCGYDREKISKDSSGLGLRLINSLVRYSLHGEIFMDSESTGTRVRFSFPSCSHEI